jgi:hypothetical protein
MSEGDRRLAAIRKVLDSFPVIRGSHSRQFHDRLIASLSMSASTEPTQLATIQAKYDGDKLHMIAREGICMPYWIPFILDAQGNTLSHADWLERLKELNPDACPVIDDSFTMPPLKFFDKRKIFPTRKGGS